MHKEFPKVWWHGLDQKTELTSLKCNPKINKYKVPAGSSLKSWESKGWIKPQDPYGWVHWYCRFFMGRRTPDDRRQIKRWLGYAGPNGRFRNQLINLIREKKTNHKDTRVSPVIRQGLLQWAYELTKADLSIRSQNK